MKRRITIKDVAREAGVSIALVSMALNDGSHKDGRRFKVKEETRIRIKEVAERMGYIPNNAAAQISSGRSRTIAVITADIDSPFFASICQHLEVLAYDSGYNVILATAGEDIRKFTDAVYKSVSIGVDGMLIIPPTVETAPLEPARALNIPVVFLERDIPDYTDGSRVLLDNEKACRLAVSEFKEHGYTRIEQITMDINVTTVTNKIFYYMKAMQELGLEEYSQVIPVKDGCSEEELDDVISRRLKVGAEAFFVPSNDLTVNMLGSFKRLGVKIPDDVALIGFDECPLFELHSPAISYIYESTAEIAQSGFELLLGMINGFHGARTVTIDPSLVSNESSRGK